MGSPAITITPDAAPVTITPDTPEQPSALRQIYEGDPNAPLSRFMHGAGMPASMAEVGPWLKAVVLPHIDEKVHPTDSFFSALNEAAKRVPVLGPMYEASENAIANPTQAAPNQNPTMTRAVGAVPVVGPLANSVAENLSTGNYAGAAGGLTAAATMARPSIVSDVASAVRPAASRVALLGRTPEEAYQSALKPSTTLSDAERAAVTNTGLQEGIPVSKEGLTKLNEAIGKVNDAIKAEIQNNPSAPINPAQAVKNLAATRAKFANQVNPNADVAAINSAGNEFLDQFRSQPGGAVRNMTAEEAQSMKQGTYRVLGEKAYGEMGSATVEAQKALARGLKEEIAKQFPEISQLNARDSKLLDLQPVLERAVAREANHQLIGIGTPIATGAAKAVTGSSSVAAVAGLLKAVLDRPTVKSQLAIALTRKGVPLSVANSRIGAYSLRLAAAAGSSQAESGASPAASSEQ